MSSIDLIRGFQTLGCKDNLKCALASMVYLDLKEDSKLKNLEQVYNEELDLIYFRGERENQESAIIVPISSCSEIDVNQIESIQQKFGLEKKGITIAISDPNSTILYYNATNDFVEK